VNHVPVILHTQGKIINRTGNRGDSNQEPGKHW